ncbi:MAG TPA: Lrp/AsnC family transcriptional regulator [Steroidobacteraceae bacterium]
MTQRRPDGIDLRILSELQRDARITYQHLSELVQLSPRPCLERVRRLEREKIIQAYTTRVDVRRLVDVVVVVAQISLAKQGREMRAAFEQSMRAREEVLECFEVSGPFDYVVKIVSPSLAAYQKLSESWLDDSSMNISRIVSNIVLRPVKDETIYPVTLAQTSDKA